MSKRKGLEAHGFLDEMSKKPKCDNKTSFSDNLETAAELVGKEEHYEDVYKMATDDDILWEFDTFLKMLPQSLLCNIRKCLIKKVRSNLKIDDIRKRKIRKFSSTTFKTPVLDALSAKLGQSVIVMTPPTSTCIYCKNPLIKNNDPVQVQLHTQHGTKIATKYIYRCKSCTQAKKHTGNKFGDDYDIHYNPTKFGNKRDGFKFYTDTYNVDIVNGSNSSYIENLLAKQYFAELHHGWLSSQAKTEAFNETYRGTDQAKQTLKFLELNPNVGRQFLHLSNDDEECEKDEDDVENDDSEKNKNTKSRMHELKTKTLSQAIVNYEIISEPKENNELMTTRLGPMKQNNKTLTFKVTQNNFMKTVNENRKSKLYEHKKCYEGCKKRGCEKISVFDGDWKIQFPICMWESSTEYPAEITSYVPQVCPEPPEYGSGFCSVHSKEVKNLGKPTKLKEFLKSCGTDPENYSKEAKGKVKDVLEAMANKSKAKQTKVGEEQGTEYLLRNKKLMNPKNLVSTESEEEPLCRKNLKECVRLRGYSRGILAACSGGGHIWSFDSLYKSEGPTQVSLLMLKYLQKKLHGIPQSEWHTYILCYDNMCNVCNLKLLRMDLPLPSPFQTVWKDIVKIIDPLHLKNHSRNKNCAVLYNPDQIREEFPSANLMVCEQTFSWLSRFKKVLNSMPKYKQLFILHRLCKWRNAYTEYCYSEGMKPVLPALKSKPPK